MASALEFAVILTAILLFVLAAGGIAAYSYRKRAEAKRLKQHFKSKG